MDINAYGIDDNYKINIPNDIDKPWSREYSIKLSVLPKKNKQGNRDQRNIVLHEDSCAEMQLQTPHTKCGPLPNPIPLSAER